MLKKQKRAKKTTYYTTKNMVKQLKDLGLYKKKHAKEGKVTRKQHSIQDEALPKHKGPR